MLQTREGSGGGGALPTASSLISATLSGFAEDTMEAVAASFCQPGNSHRPSENQVTALQEIAEVMELMASGRARPFFYLSSLDPGVGKTTTVSAGLRVLVNDSRYSDIGAVIFLSRKSEIQRLVREVGLLPRQFAVLTSDPDCNALSTSSPGRAQVLFTTQQRLERYLEKTGSFEAIDDFYYLSEPRAVRIWDESAIPGRALTLNQFDLSAVCGAIGRKNTALGTAIDRMRSEVLTLGNKDTFYIPDFAADFGVAVEEAKGYANDNDIKSRISSLWFLGGRMVTVRKDGSQQTCLDYLDVFTEDLKPMLILDASGRVRETYRIWQLGNRGDLHRLHDAPKNYTNLRVSVWNRHGSKTSWKNSLHHDEMVSGIVATLNLRPKEHWLVITHKLGTISAPRLKAEILREFRGDRLNVRFIEWGSHTATNDHRTVKNVILAGLLYLPKSALEATGRAAAGKPSSEGAFPEATVSTVEKGEHLHNILQALCRANVRNSDGGGCGECHAYVIAPARSRLREALGEVFPGCQIDDWTPMETKAIKPTRKQAEAISVILAKFKTDPDAIVPFPWVASQIGMEAANFKKRIRSDHRFIAERIWAGIGERRDVRGRSGFVMAG